MSTINKRVLESFRKKLSNDQLTQLFNLLNKINFNRTLKSKGGSVGSLMDTSFNPLKINTIDTIQPIRSMYQKGGQVNKSEILDLIKKIYLKDLNLTELNLIKELSLEDK